MNKRDQRSLTLICSDSENCTVIGGTGGSSLPLPRISSSTIWWHHQAFSICWLSPLPNFLSLQQKLGNWSRDKGGVDMVKGNGWLLYFISLVHQGDEWITSVQFHHSFCFRLETKTNRWDEPYSELPCYKILIRSKRLWEHACCLWQSIQIHSNIVHSCCVFSPFCERLTQNST